MPMIRFLERCAGREKGDEELNGDAALCSAWVHAGVVELIEELEVPAMVEDRAIRSPRGRRGRPPRRPAVESGGSNGG